MPGKVEIIGLGQVGKITFLGFNLVEQFLQAQRQLQGLLRRAFDVTGQRQLRVARRPVEHEVNKQMCQPRLADRRRHIIQGHAVGQGFLVDVTDRTDARQEDRPPA